MFFIDDGQALGDTYASFQKSFKSGQSGYRRIEELRDKMAPHTLRRTKDKALKLPKKSFTRIQVDLAPKQREMYEKMREDLELWVRKMSGSDVLEQADAILARMVRLAQLSSNPGLLDAAYKEVPGKIDKLDVLLKQYLANPKRKVIVWTSFVENIRVLAKRYKKYEPVVIYGEMDNVSRDRSIYAFKHDPKVRLMVANPAAAREGLTLTEANIAIYLDRTFNLVDYLQSQDRIHRISQTKACEIVVLVARNTVDEFIDFSLEQKHRLARFTQSDTHAITAADLALEKPDILRALLAPAGTKPKRSRAGKLATRAS